MIEPSMCSGDTAFLLNYFDHLLLLLLTLSYKNSSGDEIANVNFFYNIAHVEASAYAH